MGAIKHSRFLYSDIWMRLKHQFQDQHQFFWVNTLHYYPAQRPLVSRINSLTKRILIRMSSPHRIFARAWAKPRLEQTFPACL